jgi:NAD(P)-dependent dehydrogenase (short-subunit alcohol dehydrogenase family)
MIEWRRKREQHGEASIMSELAGKVALVTGGGRGIGRAAAVELARRGAQVAVAARSQTEIEESVAAIRQAGGTGIAATVDLLDPAATQALVEQVQRSLGPIAVLVNNAAMVGPFGRTWELSGVEWERSLTVNLIAPFRLAQAVLPSMLQAGWGRIINISSAAARAALERGGAYSVSKAGLDMLTQQLGIELHGSGVAAICVYPGVVDTVMQTAIREQPAEVVGERVAELFQGFYNEGRLQTPDRPARLIAALAGAAGAEFNGQIVDIYGEQGQALLNS